MARAISFAEIENEPRNRIEQLIEDIRTTFLRISFRPTRDDFIMTGEKLLALKAQCRHGTWLATLKSIGKPDVRTAQECMQWAKAKNSSFSDSMNGFLREQRAARKAAIHAVREEQRQEAVENLLGVENAQRIYHKDNRQFNWPAADGIYLDPPWQDLSHYEWGAELADRVLVPGGLLWVQCLADRIGKVMSIMTKTLQEVSTLCISYGHAGEPRCGFDHNWRPVLLFSKGKYQQTGRIVTDTITVTGKEQKIYHAWEQPIGPFLKWIPCLHQPEAMLLDPFSCSGMWACACKQLGMRNISTEKDKGMVAVSRKRLKETCV